MSLAIRQERFKRLTSSFQSSNPDPLITYGPIDPELFHKLRIAVAAYVSRSLPGRKLILDEQELLDAFERERETIRNCTPNGMLVPKRHLILEYNALMRACAQIADALRIGEHIDSWHVPFNVRFKDRKPREENMSRATPTEHMHSDAWAGESATSVNFIIPVFGDVEHNGVRYLSPPETFTEEWLKPLKNYAEGAALAQQYKPVDLTLKKGNIYMADFAILHATWRTPDAGPRISIDTTFSFKNSAQDAEYRHPWNESERASHADLMNLGETKLMAFYDKEGEISTNRDGLRTANMRIIDIGMAE